MYQKSLEGARILLVQSDGVLAVRLAEAFAAVGAEVVTTFGLPETFHEIGRNDFDAALVHLDLDGVSGLPAAVLLGELGVPLAIVAPNQMSAFLARHLPGVIALNRSAPVAVAVTAVARAAGRRPPPMALVRQAPQRQNSSPSLA